MLLRSWIVLTALSLFIAPCARAKEPQTIESLISHHTRLIVFSPHPDDECLGAAGLMQRVLHAGGKVRVVFMTSGDGYTEAVEKEDHTLNPSPVDYLKYGKEREGEALKALAALGLKKRYVTFLGFPDGGLSALLSKFRSDPQVYTSPCTKESRPPKADILIPNTDYNDQDLRREIVRVLVHFNPTLVATTPPQDQHPDHSSTYYIVKEALGDLEQAHPSIKPELITFLIHFGGWPVNLGYSTQSGLVPPQGFPDTGAKWASLALRPQEVETKRKAILQYRSQVPVLGWFLPSFVRTNELFLLTP